MVMYCWVVLSVIEGSMFIFVIGGSMFIVVIGGSMTITAIEFFSFDICVTW